MSSNSLILAVSPFDVIHIASLGYEYVVGLITLGMTQEQENLLARFKRILIIHPNPDNISLRLSQKSFVKVFKTNEIFKLIKEQIHQLF